MPGILSQFSAIPFRSCGRGTTFPVVPVFVVLHAGALRSSLATAGSLPPVEEVSSEQKPQFVLIPEPSCI